VFAVSIACQINGRLEVAAIYDPLRLELFTATRGVGAQLENRKIRVTKQRTLEGSLIATGLPFRGDAQQTDDTCKCSSRDEPRRGIRRAGSAALDLAYVAAGRVDGFGKWASNPGTLQLGNC